MGWDGRRRDSPEFVRNRRLARKRDDDTCQRCGDIGTEVNHIVALAEGGTDELENLETLCASCHWPETVEQTTRAIRRHAAWGRHPGERHPGLA